MSAIEAPLKTVRLGVTGDQSLLCVGFAPALTNHELAGLPHPFSLQVTAPEIYGWPSQQILSPPASEELIIATPRQAFTTILLHSTVADSAREGIEEDPRAAYKHLAKYAAKIARGLHRQLVPHWFEAVPTDDGNKLILGPQLALQRPEQRSIDT